MGKVNKEIKIFFKMKKYSKYKLVRILYFLYLKICGSYIGTGAIFEEIPYFPHGLKGIFISGGVKLGRIVLFTNKLQLVRMQIKKV